METRRRNSLSRVICQTQEVPDTVQNDIEMGAVQSLEESLPTRCDHKVCQMRCGNASNFTVPMPPSGTLLSIHQAAAIWCALDLESTRLKRPANFLVWGLGNDSPFWAKSTSGRVAFIEGNSDWFSKIKGSNPGLEQYLVKYSSKIQRDLPRLGTQELEKEMNHIILDDLPLQETVWDIFLVDTPNGCSKSDVGRFASAHTSRRLAVMQGHGHIFVDDYQRTPDRRISNFVLDASQECKDSTNDAEKNCGKRVAIWNRIHPASRKYIEKLAMFSFGACAAKESLDVMRLVEGATRW